MAPENDTSVVGRELIARLNEKIQHVNEIIAQKMEYQNKFLEQRLDTIDKVNAEKMLGFSTRLEEALAEIHGYKDILQQQLVLLDSSIKKAWSRIDEINAHGTAFNTAEVDAIRKELTESVRELEAMMENIHQLEDSQRDKEIVETTKANDPLRKFFEENGKKVLLVILTAIGLYLLKNLPDFLNFLQTTVNSSGG